MAAVDPRLVSALSLQLTQWRATLATGAGRVGWKLGVGERERIGTGPVIGHLTTATQLELGAVYRGGGIALHADAEIALALGDDVDPHPDRGRALEAIAGYGSALEIVDLRAPLDDPHSVVASNVFHRAFALGALDHSPPAAAPQARLIVNGDVRASSASSLDPAALICVVSTLLATVGERLLAGDRLLTGAVVQTAIQPGDRVMADLGPLGQAELTIATEPRQTTAPKGSPDNP